MNSSNIFNIRKKSTLITLVSFLPKIKKLELIRENKRLQKALGVKEVLYQIYNIKKPEYNNSTYDLTVYGKDEYTKREILKSFFEICKLPFFNNIGFELNSGLKNNSLIKNDLYSKRSLCHSKIINNILILPPLNEGQILVGSYSWDNTFKIWDIQTNTLLHTLKLPLEDIIAGVIPLYNMHKIQSNKKQPILITIVTWDKSIITYDLRTNDIYLVKNIDLFGKIMCIIRVNNYLLFSSYESEINIFNINDLINKPKEPELTKLKINPKKIFTLKGHKGPIPKIISYDSKRIISCGWDESIKIWNLDKFICEDSINNIGDKLINITLLKDKITLGVVLNYGDIKLLNLKTKEILMKFSGTYFIYELNDHRIITIFHEIQLKIININTKKMELLYKTSHDSKISGLVQLDDGRLVTCSYDQTIKVHGFVSKREKSKDAEDFIYSYGDNCLYITHKSQNKDNL